MQFRLPTIEEMSSMIPSDFVANKIIFASLYVHYINFLLTERMLLRGRSTKASKPGIDTAAGAAGGAAPTTGAAAGTVAPLSIKACTSCARI